MVQEEGGWLLVYFVLSDDARFRTNRKEGNLNIRSVFPTFRTRKCSLSVRFPSSPVGNKAFFRSVFQGEASLTTGLKAIH